MGRVDYGYQPYGHATISLQWKPGDGIRVPTDHRGVTPPSSVTCLQCYASRFSLNCTWEAGIFFLVDSL